MKAIVYEAFQHFIPTGEGWAKGLEALGWEVYRLPSVEYSITDVDGPVDLLIVHDVNVKVASDLIEYKRENPSVKVGVLCSSFEPCFNHLQPYVDLWFNLSIQNNYLAQKFGEKGMKFRSVQLAAHPDRSFPVKFPKEFDVSFFGQIGSQGHGYRGEDKYLNPFLNQKYKGAFGGFPPFAPVAHKALNQIYNATKVNLNFHYSNQKVESPTDPLSRIELNGRVFEIALSGNFQISDHPRIKEFFGDTVPYVEQDKWVEMVDYFIKNNDEREFLAKDAREVALKLHTYSCRAKQILQEIGL